MYFSSAQKFLGQDLESLCLGRPSDLDKVLFDISSSGGKTRFERAAVKLTLVGLGYPIVMSEVIMYAQICVFLIQHDKTMALVLPAGEVRGRIRKNVIDLSGHVINFLIEILMLVLAALGTFWMPINMRNVARCLFMSSYGILGAFHISFSPVLRRELSRLIRQN